ncbi:MAG TPA: cytochrome c biogenesis protein CcsA, partial [Blastocatellia bacterium]|nr:cytochrome c biogenesis protein CcsA [Blastocatellia bacterium]
MDFLLLAALLLYLASAFYAVINLVAKTQVSEENTARTNRSLRLLVISGFALHTLSLIVSGITLGHFPVVNPKEMCSFIGWAVVAYYLTLSRRYRARALPVFVLPSVFLLTLTSLALPQPEVPISGKLAGQISANITTQIIFPLHVTLLAFSYAAFVVTVVAGVMYLVQERELKTKKFGAAFHWLPALNTCDDICYRALTVGFVLLTLGMATGLAWSVLTDGRLWHNDPREVTAVITWG